MKEKRLCKQIDLGLDSKEGSSHVYDMIWGTSHTKKSGMIPSRRPDLMRLLHPGKINVMLKKSGMTWGHPVSNQAVLHYAKGYNLSDQTVVDFGSGMGAYSTAAAELGAKKVYMLDGSRRALDGYEERLQKTTDLHAPADKIIDTVTKCHIDLNNPNRFISYLDKAGKADLVFSRYVIMHTANPYMSLYNMTRLCRPGSKVAFNIFINSAVSEMIRIERSHIQKFPWGLKEDLFRRLGKFRKAETSMTVEEFLDGAGPESLSPIRDVYNKHIVPRFLMSDIVEHCFHVENSTTPYIHTPRYEKILEFMEEMKVAHAESPSLMLKQGHPSQPPDELWAVFRVTEETLMFEKDQVPRIELFQ